MTESHPDRDSSYEPPSLSDEAELQAWTIAELDSITEQVNHTLENPNPGAGAEILNHANQWHTIYFDPRRPTAYSEEVTHAMGNLTATIHPILASTNPYLSKADLVETLLATGRFWDPFEVSDAAIKHTRAQGASDLLPLLERDSKGGAFAAQTIRWAIETPYYNQQEVIAHQTLMPLAERLPLAAQDHLSGATVELEAIRIALETIDAHPQGQERAADAGIDLPHVADLITDTCFTRIDPNSRISHHVTREILTSFKHLFLPTNKAPREMPEGMNQFLTTIHTMNLAGYASRRDIRDMRQTFNELAEANNLELRA
jgi:hypothetical protein